MKSITRAFRFSIFLLFLVTGCVPQKNPTPTGAAPGATNTSLPKPTITSLPAQEYTNILFDDFNYSTRDEMTANGWILRAQAGWPGVTGATFRPENVSFVDDTTIPTNRILRMTSSTDGSSANTFQTQICHQRKYLEGTYAARVYFNNGPVSGPDGDQIVETFYDITPYEAPLKPDYSEMDFEYLPNGGWGLAPMTFAFTTWETVRIEPWLADNASNSRTGSMEGWHILVLQAVNGEVRYYIDGNLVAEHGGNYYPDARMSINFNLWFINGGLIASNETRSYQEDIDWVFHEAGVTLSPDEVNQKIQALRDGGIDFLDTVPAGSPPLPSSCDL
jgi:hypothetical protein